MSEVVEKRLVEITAIWAGMSMAAFPKGAKVRFLSRNGEQLREDWRKCHYAWVQAIGTDKPQEYVGIHQLRMHFLENVTYTYEEV